MYQKDRIIKTSDGIIIQGYEPLKLPAAESTGNLLTAVSESEFPSIRGYGDYFSFNRNCDGVTPVNFLKATLKAESVLNPLS